MDVEIVCIDCGEEGCYQCGLFGGHKSHTVIKLV